MALPTSGVPLSPDQLQPDFGSLDLEPKPVKPDEARTIVLGQDRAIEATILAAGLNCRDFNLFVVGDSGFGRHEMVRSIFRQEASKRSTPSDWIYVNNFDEPHKPVAIELPCGTAPRFKQAMELLVDDLANDIPALFEAEDYQNKRRSLEQDFGESHEKAFAELMESISKRGLMLMRTPMGFMVVAAKDERPMKPEEFEELPKKEREEIDRNIKEAQEKLSAVLKQIPKREKDHRRSVERLNFEIAQRAVEEAFSQIESDFGEFEKLNRYLIRVRTDLIENAVLFLQTDPAAQAGGFPVATTKHYKKPQFQRYAVNVIVTHPDGEERGAPVVTENLPTLANLLGRIEHQSEMGMLSTDFTMIKPGALHRANGGFLILDARAVLSEPFAWDTLKRCIRTGEIAIVSAQERYSLITTKSLDPDPISLQVTIALIGDRYLYYLLSAFDPDFGDLFKVQAEFNERIAPDAENISQFVQLASSLAQQQEMPPPDKTAILRLLTEASRIAEDSQRLSPRIGKLSDIIREAGHIASQNRKTKLSANEIEIAISAAEKRAAVPKERVYEAIDRNVILIQTEGEAIGQINALSVHQIGEHSFGRPSRVTARTRMGKGNIIDIEREVELGGPLHSKGVLILSGYLASHFALDVPLSLWASIVFEQSYGGVDGDSASAAELFALLSSLSGTPIKQSLAVTGSVNQRGDIQAIGGVNQKIEGFFDVCDARGLTGTQGVLIPESNVKHLNLRARVVDAVRKNQFSLIPIATIDEGIELLTGVSAGKRTDSESFPKGSVNALVEECLRQYAARQLKFARSHFGADGNGK